MKKQILCSIAFAFFLTGCKKEVTETPTTVTETPKAEAPKTECYSYDANGSKIEAQLHYTADSITGTLNYALAEKDKNTGTIKGKLENDILIAEYTFQSEGSESVRQVAFQVKDGKLIEGYGDLNQDGTRFKDVSQLKFDSKMPLVKGECNE